MVAASQIGFLPIDLGRWDRCPGGMPWSCPCGPTCASARSRWSARLAAQRSLVRLLREAAGSVIGEKLLFLSHPGALAPSLTIGWARHSFSEDAFRTSLGAVLDASAPGVQSAGLAPPAATWIASRQSELCAYSSRLPSSAKSNTGFGLSALTIIDVPSAIRPWSRRASH